MRTRIFLRTSEFLWQEGHTAHATADEAVERTRMMLEVYAAFAEKFLAIPVIKGRKSASERFPGAVETECIEAMMQDRKALQMGTSHFLGQNFARASNIRFQNAEESEDLAWTTSWGTSTRMIGGLIMTHSDDDGLVLPPKVASAHVVLLPILHDPDQAGRVMDYTQSLAAQLRKTRYHDRNLSVEIDQRDIGGARGWDWIRKGVPLRVEIGPRDIDNEAVFFARRDRGHREKTSMDRNRFVEEVAGILDEIQQTLFDRALSYRREHTVVIDDRQAFDRFFTPKNEERPEIHGGFALSHWCGGESCEADIKEDLNVTIRCIPFDGERQEGRCICCGQPSNSRVVFAKAY